MINKLAIFFFTEILTLKNCTGESPFHASTLGSDNTAEDKEHFYLIVHNNVAVKTIGNILSVNNMDDFSWTKRYFLTITSLETQNIMLPPCLGGTLISLYRLTSCCVQMSYVKYHFYAQFNRGVFVEWFWDTSVLTIKRHRLSAAEMGDFSTISSRPD